MAENKTKTESKSKNENAMTDYIDLMIGSDGAFTFHGFGKLDGITIELPDKAIRKLVPAMVSYLWQKMYWVPMHFTQKQRKALSSIAFEDIEAMVAGYREEGRRRKEADAQAKQMIGFDKSRFEAIRNAVSSLTLSDGEIDADAATPILFPLLNSFIDDNSNTLANDPDDTGKHYLRLALTERILTGWPIDDDFYSEQEASDDDAD